MARKGFTLVELLVVIGMLVILLGILFPAVQRLREVARRISCHNNLRNLAIGVGNFDSVFSRFPTGIHGGANTPTPYRTWLVEILPYIEEQNLWDQSRNEFSISNDPFTHQTLRESVTTFGCPADPRSGQVHETHDSIVVASTSYVGCNGLNYRSQDGIFYRDSKTRSQDVRDGLSNTLLMGERPPSADFWYGWWYAGYGQLGSGSPDMLLGVREINEGAKYLYDCPPGPYEFEAGKMDVKHHVMHYWSFHATGANFARADGSVVFLPYKANEVISHLATRAGGEIFESAW